MVNLWAAVCECERMPAANPTMADVKWEEKEEEEEEKQHIIYEAN